jgi:hypothetical protein
MTRYGLAAACFALAFGSIAASAAADDPLAQEFTNPPNAARPRVWWHYIDNRSDRAASFTATFRVTGREAELWHADTGTSEPASYTIDAGRTAVPIALGPYETLFVVFNRPAPSNTRVLSPPRETPLAMLDGPWSISFDKGPCAPEPAAFERLQSWSDSADPRLRYFSGTATYRKTLQGSAGWLTGKGRVWLDLGSVKNLAEIVLNGKTLGIVWKPPFRVDVTPALRAGDNRLEVKVTDLWVNRLIGDMQRGIAAKCTFTDPQPFYQPSSPLLPAGLLGPVRLVGISSGS